MKPSLLIVAFLFLLAGCEHDLTVFPYEAFPISEDFSSIADPRARWKAYNLRDYIIEQEPLCFCGLSGKHQVVVRENKVVSAANLQTKSSVPVDYFRTIDEIFDWLDVAKLQNPAVLEVEYHPRFGYPTKIRYDESFNRVDEELTLYMRSLRKIHP
ncbi:DUF6174 domain-containing protein [candidate division KSB1 bacterium]|nr:DUF6174 domain-containing protein [candidate division KSB1 bacterium]